MIVCNSVIARCMVEAWRSGTNADARRILVDELERSENNHAREAVRVIRELQAQGVHPEVAE